MKLRMVQGACFWLALKDRIGDPVALATRRTPGERSTHSVCTAQETKEGDARSLELVGSIEDNSIAVVL